MRAIHRALDAGSDPRQLARQIVEYLRAIMLFQMGNEDQVDETQTIKTRMKIHSEEFSAVAVLRMIKAFNTAAVEQRGGWQPSLGLELALADVMEINEPAAVVEQRAQPKQGTASPRAVKRAQVPEVATVKKTESSPQAGREASPPPQLVQTNEIINAWKDIRARVKKMSPNVEALLNSCKSLDVKGDTLMIGMASDVLVDKLEKPEQVAMVQKAIQDKLNVQLAIKCVVTDAKGEIPSHIDQNGLVAAALQAGGKLSDIQE